MAAGADRMLDAATLYESLNEAIADCSFVAGDDRAQSRPGQSGDFGGGGRRLKWRRGWAAGRALRSYLGASASVSKITRSRGRSYRDAAGQSGVCLAQSGAGGCDRCVRVVQACRRRRSAILHAGKIAAGCEAAARCLLFRSRKRAGARSSFSAPKKNAARWASICAIFSSAWRRPNRTSAHLHGVLTAIAQGRKGPARGGVLDPVEAQKLRDLVAEHGGGRAPGERGPLRGLARLLRRNPTDAERVLWQALVNDRRFAGRGFKRQVPIGPHIADFVSLPLKCVIDLMPRPRKTAAAARRGREARLAGSARLSSVSK